MLPQAGPPPVVDGRPFAVRQADLTAAVVPAGLRVLVVADGDDAVRSKARDYKEATLKSLFALSGNQCAYGACRHPVIDEFGSVVAQIAHIKGVKPTSARYEQCANDEELRDVGNLVLLCNAHHIATDDVSVWTVEKMRAMKTAHENRFGGVVAGLRAQVEDQTTATVVRPPKNLGKLHEAIGLNLEPEELAKQVQLYAQALERFARLPPDALSVIATSLAHGKSDSARPERYEVTVGMLKQVLGVESATLDALLNILVLQDYAWLEGEHRDGYRPELWLTLKGGVPGTDAEMLWADVGAAIERLGASAVTLLVDLDWRQIDLALDEPGPE